MHRGSNRYQVKNRQQGIENEGDNGANQLRSRADWNVLIPEVSSESRVSTSDFQADLPERWGRSSNAWAQALR